MISLNFDTVFLTSIFMIITSLAIFIVIYFFKNIINNMIVELRNKQLENRSIVSSLRREVNNMNVRISQVIQDLDSISTRVYKLESYTYELPKTQSSMESSSLEKESSIQPKRIRTIKGKRTISQLNKTERKILELLSNGPKSSREIRDSLDLSREHVARELKSLYEKGYVLRYTESKPYVYEITEEGLSILGK